MGKRKHCGRTFFVDCSVTSDVVWVAQRLKPGLCGENLAVNREQGTVLLLVAVNVNRGIKTYVALRHGVFVANSGEAGGG